MKLYLLHSRVPELAPLTKLQRKLVYQCAFMALAADRPSIFVVSTILVFGGALGGLLAGWALATGGLLPAGWAEHRIGVMVVGAVAGVVAGTCVGGQWMNALLRPYFQRVLAERKEELLRLTQPPSDAGQPPRG